MVSEHASPLAVLGSADAGGQNVHVGNLAQALGRRGVEVVVHTRRDDASLPRHVELKPNVVVDHVDAGPAVPLPKDELLPHMGQFARALVERWSEQPPDVVHSHFWMSGLAALEAAQCVGLPVAHTYHALGVVKRRHQGQADTSSPERLDIEARLAREADLVIATTAEESFELGRMGGDLDRIRVVPCGVDLGLFRPDGPVGPPRSDRPRLVAVSRLVERKGIGNVMSALNQLPEAELLVAGGPPAGVVDGDPEGDRLRRLANELRVTDRVELLGALSQQDVAALMRSADVVACCPWYEPFGLVAVEAMACGLPIVASAVGGLAETVIDGVTGIQVPPRCPDRIADAVRHLLGDAWLRQAMGRAGTSRSQRYGWDRIAAETLAALRPLATRKTTVAGMTPTARRPPAVKGATVPRASMLGQPSSVGQRGPVRRSRPRTLPTGASHLAALRGPLDDLEAAVDRIDRWGIHLAGVLAGGGRLLAVGNGGSAAQAQHLTSELVGRYRHEREPFSAIALCSDPSSVTALANDYGSDEIFARQVLAHGRRRDVLVALSTSGRSPNVLAAVAAARRAGLTTWGLTGQAPNPLAERVDDAVVVDALFTATVQEIHQIVVHLLCAAVDVAIGTAVPELAGSQGS